MTKPIITVDRLAKAYRIGLKEEVPDTLVGAAKSFARNPLKNFQRLRRLDTFSENGDADDVVWALKDVSFEVNEGEVVGVIGRNGAGKSTLLKILSRITEPTRGRAVIRGRVSSLLEVGTGFHPDMTGRDNIYMNGTILGMTKREIDRKFDEIVDFSGVEKFLDTPVKRYSSGMTVRLAFAVAAHLEPEILIVDEVLAVGDAEFQRKCLGKMQDVAEAGRTVLFVSHNMPAVTRLTRSCLWFSYGELRAAGPTEDIAAEYLALANSVSSSAELPSDPSKPMRLRRISVGTDQQPDRAQIEFSDPVVIRLEYDVNHVVRNAHVACFVATAEGTVLFGTGDADIDHQRFRARDPGRYEATWKVPPKLLGEGTYNVTVTMGIPYESIYDRHEGIVRFGINDSTSKRRLLQHTRRPGLLGIEIPWEVKKVPLHESR